MNISVFGLGYVGAVTAACLAKIGHRVTGVDIAGRKVDLINTGRSPIAEPGLDEVVADAVEAGRLIATTSAAEGLRDADVAIVCVGTPSRHNGEVDTSALEAVTQEIARHAAAASDGLAVIVRSTVPPGTMEETVLPAFRLVRDGVSTPSLIYHPEFLREGAALNDFHEAPQVVVASVGGSLPEAALRELMTAVYDGVPIRLHVVEPKTAEMIKYVNNTYHALKVSFANEVGRVCRGYGVDVHELFDLFLADTKLNVSAAYLRPGFAYGGSCLPKDLRALAKMATRADVETPVIANIGRSNEIHVQTALDLVMESGAARVAFLGLSFKPNTDDVRESPLLSLVEQCIGKGLEVKIFDRCICGDTLMGQNEAYLHAHLDHVTERLVGSPEDAVADADLVVLGHAVPAYLAAVDGAGKRVLDLTGRFQRSELTPGMLSVVLSELPGADPVRRGVLRRVG
ncbi:MAG: nucleotide sugar dehydrogenase [Rubricoccaceae bacterium]|nr:nucleotide sugar dehydrogenase [Rubricoccaceae bacterium]